MLIVSGIIEIDPDKLEPAVEAAKAMGEATRHEAGCHTYAFYTDIEDPSRFRVFEEWENLAALEAHFQTDHMAEFRAALATVGIRSRSVWRYEVSTKVKL